MKGTRDFLRLYIVPIVLLAGILLTACFTGLYTVTARTPEGKIISTKWPSDFTLAFSQYISGSGDGLAVSDAGKTLLDENGLWLQILDSAGRSVFQYHTPPETPDAYEPYALVSLYQKGTGTSSVFMRAYTADGASYTYLIGFPMHISKAVLYVDAARYRSGRVLIVAVVGLTALLVVILTVYSYRTYLSAERGRARDEKAKEEWLANITHDLKTPLAPIRGYGELLAGEGEPSPEDVRRYGAIILKNALYTEQLVEDLKLTYQLGSNLVPLQAEKQNLIRFVREAVIDMLNAPEYAGRDIAFSADREEQMCVFDGRLFRRALMNVLVNAVKHNGPDTAVTVTVVSVPTVSVTVSDNGSGMTPEELTRLFNRYYRGTSTEVKAEGSGLGMAIAKQIVEAHGGRIGAASRVGEGTTVTMTFPPSFKV